MSSVLLGQWEDTLDGVMGGFSVVNTSRSAVELLEVSPVRIDAELEVRGAIVLLPKQNGGTHFSAVCGSLPLPYWWHRKAHGFRLEPGVTANIALALHQKVRGAHKFHGFKVRYSASGREFEQTFDFLGGYDTADVTEDELRVPCSDKSRAPITLQTSRPRLRDG